MDLLAFKWVRIPPSHSIFQFGLVRSSKKVPLKFWRFLTSYMPCMISATLPRQIYLNNTTQNYIVFTEHFLEHSTISNVGEHKRIPWRISHGFINVVCIAVQNEFVDVHKLCLRPFLVDVVEKIRTNKA